MIVLGIWKTKNTLDIMIEYLSLYAILETCIQEIKRVVFLFYAYIGNINVESPKYLNKT